MKPCNSPGCYFPIFSTGFCRMHQHLRKDEKYLRGKKSLVQKHIEKIKGEWNNELDEFYKRMREKMTGTCAECFGRSGRNSDKFYRHSLAHILPKAYFPSVALNEDNIIELCFWENSCHSKYDASWQNVSRMRIFRTIIVPRIEKLYPLLTREERRRIPEIIIQELNVNI